MSIAHRSYCEGDRLLAEAERHRAEAKKLEAEAEVITNAARANGVKEITGEAQPYDPDYEDEAMAMMREVERQQPRAVAHK